MWVKIEVSRNRIKEISASVICFSVGIWWQWWSRDAHIPFCRVTIISVLGYILFEVAINLLRLTDRSWRAAPKIVGGKGRLQSL
jgi:hypothetical protein